MKKIFILIIFGVFFTLVGYGKSLKIEYDLYPLMKNKKWGFVDTTGKWIIEPKYDSVDSFNKNGLASAKFNEKFGYINIRGKWMLEPKFDRVCDFSDNGLAAVRFNNKVGFINVSGEWVIKPKFDNELWKGCPTFENGMAYMKIKDKWGYIDINGKWIIDPDKYDEIGEFSEFGMASIKLNGKYGAVNNKGKIVTKPEFDGRLYFYKNGLSEAKLNGKYGLVNIKGQWIVKPRFDRIWSFTKNGLIPVKLNKKWGFINAQGEWVVEPQFENFRAFFYSMAAAKLNGKWGYINAKGKWLIEPQFEVAGIFSRNGLAAIKLNKKWGFINRKGDLIIEPKFEKVENFSNNGLAIVKQGSKFGVIDRLGNWIVKPKFDNISFVGKLIGVEFGHSFDYKMGYTTLDGKYLTFTENDYKNYWKDKKLYLNDYLTIKEGSIFYLPLTLDFQQKIGTNRDYLKIKMSECSAKMGYCQGTYYDTKDSTVSLIVTLDKRYRNKTNKGLIIGIDLNTKNDYFGPEASYYPALLRPNLYKKAGLPLSLVGKVFDFNNGLAVMPKSVFIDLKEQTVANILGKTRKQKGNWHPPYLIEGTNCVDHNDGRNGEWLSEMYRRGGVLDSKGCLLNSDNLNKKSISKKAISDAENLSNAIELNDEHKVRELLNQGYDPNMIGSPNREPVICFSEGRPKILKLLLEYGANPNVLCFNQVTKETSSLLKNTIYWNEVASAKLLLKHGASLDSRSINRKTKSDSKYNSILVPLVHDHNAKDLLKIAKSDAMKSLLRQYVSDTKISQASSVQENNKVLEERQNEVIISSNETQPQSKQQAIKPKLKFFYKNENMDIRINYTKMKDKIDFTIGQANLSGFSNIAGGVSVSFPEIKIKNKILNIQGMFGMDADRYPAGSKIWNGELKKQITAKYLLVEGWSKKWNKNEIKILKFTVDTKGLKKLKMNIRATLIKNKQDYVLPRKGEQDQQGYVVENIVIDLSKKEEVSSDIQVQNTVSKHVKITNFSNPTDEPKGLYIVDLEVGKQSKRYRLYCPKKMVRDITNNTYGKSRSVKDEDSIIFLGKDVLRKAYNEICVNTVEYKPKTIQETSVPVMIGGEPEEDACGGAGEIRGISRHGDGYIAVRSGPGTKYKIIDKIYRNGTGVAMCDSHGKWEGVVYGKGNCGTGSPVNKRQPYRGECKSGWVFEKYVRLVAG